jgi:uncharacterized membrane protein YgdD (TMEM256/DUF423 family)
MLNTFVILAAILGFTGVALGAFGAHALAPRFQQYPHLENPYKTGVQYHLYHALAMLGVAWASTRWPGGLTAASGILFLIGVVLFSGSLYLMTLTNNRKLGAITPLGGLAFLAGWACLLLAALGGG